MFEGVSDVGEDVDEDVLLSSSFIELALVPQSTASKPPTVKC